MKVCMNCKAQVEDSIKFCPKCGGGQFTAEGAITQYSSNNVSNFSKAPISSPTLVSGNSGKPKTKAAFVMSIIALSLCWLPVAGIILATIALIMAIVAKAKKDEFSKTAKATVALLLTIVAIVLSVLITRAIISGDTSDSQNSSAVTESDSKPAVLSEEEIKNAYIARCTALDYKAVERDPDKYDGKYAVIQGEVVEALEMFFLGDEPVTLRINENCDSDLTWYVTYTKKEGESRILEDDLVKIYGVCKGVHTYEAILGNSVTIPYIEAEYVELVTSGDGSGAAGEGTAFDANSVAEQITITDEYEYKADYGNYHQFVIARNDSEFTIELSGKVKFYNEDGELIGYSSESLNVVGPGEEVCFNFSNEDEYSSHDITWSVSKVKQHSAVCKDINVDVTTTKNKAIIEATNNGERAAEFVQFYVIFFKDDKVVGYDWGYIGDSDSEIKPGNSEMHEASCYKDFDLAKVYISGRRK